ncbi:MAG TPA: glutamine--fructose-6-phosphate transaminase (isomerizing) [Candidatus Udaeobacter sp.]|nr:glutamine--fructose-6-phosphate transaminase (isomerizing) [Candidatus Udaeobacter sp.]
MCGIVGILGNQPAAPRLVEGLKRLAYRGYDSAGIATLVNGHIDRRRAEGKIANLEALLGRSPLPGAVGIGHTRWATHGRPSESNAHPHATERVAIVHNGIIENFQALREELADAGRRFETETDSEVVAHLLTDCLERQMSPEQAMAATLPRLKGAFSLAIIFAGRPDLLMGARRGAPLAVGYGEGEMYLGSDGLALAPFTQRVCYLEEDDWAVLRHDGARYFNKDREVKREVITTAVSGAVVGKGNHRHFMMKEICEQPAVIGETLQSLTNPLTRRTELGSLPIDLAAIDRLSIVACGTAYYAGMVGKYWFEKIARLPVEVDIASEFRYRGAPLAKSGATLVISQSGETADSIAALRYAKSQGQKVLAVLNAPESTMARESHHVLPTLAGPEVGVASTKAFTTQLTVLACLALGAARARGEIDAAGEAALFHALSEVPARLSEILASEAKIHSVAAEIAEARDVLFLGRGSTYPIALEGALKLKELSYIHAEGYAAGEMKHGPIALIDEAMPVIVVAPSDELFDKTASNLEEAAARGGRVILISDKAGIARLGAKATRTIELPACEAFVAPILYALPVQLLAYHAAVIKGTDVDQPRNLAKSVTVE